jgi:hypothetical protein
MKVFFEVCYPNLIISLPEFTFNGLNTSGHFKNILEKFSPYCGTNKEYSILTTFLENFRRAVARTRNKVQHGGDPGMRKPISN